VHLFKVIYDVNLGNVMGCIKSVELYQLKLCVYFHSESIPVRSSMNVLQLFRYKFLCRN
jgi:hypothetical protein